MGLPQYRWRQYCERGAGPARILRLSKPSTRSPPCLTFLSYTLDASQGVRRPPAFPLHDSLDYHAFQFSAKHWVAPTVDSVRQMEHFKVEAKAYIFSAC